MQRTFTRLILAALVMQTLAAHAALNSERTMYLGVLNGQVQGNSVVKVNRTLPEPVLFRVDNGETPPDKLIIRSAQARPASEGMLYVTVTQKLPQDGKEALITLKTSLLVDGQKVAPLTTQQGNDVVIVVPTAGKQVELRTDAPVELQVPANYRGNVQVEMLVEGENTI